MSMVKTAAVTGGVDTHADSHVAAALDGIGGPAMRSAPRGRPLSGRASGAPRGRDGQVEAIRALMVAKRSSLVGSCLHWLCRILSRQTGRFQLTVTVSLGFSC